MISHQEGGQPSPNDSESTNSNEENFDETPVKKIKTSKKSENEEKTKSLKHSPLLRSDEEDTKPVKIEVKVEQQAIKDTN
jgi:hypothetical protein